MPITKEVLAETAVGVGFFFHSVLESQVALCPK